jgi:hypothetical protein
MRQMRQLAKQLLVGALVLGAAVPAWAQEDRAEGDPLYAPDSMEATDKAARVVGREGIKSIRLFGALELAGVYRSGGYDRLFFRRGSAPVPGPSDPAGNLAGGMPAGSPAFNRQTSGRDESFIDAVLSIGVEITVNDALSGYFRLETGPANAYGAEAHRVGDNANFARFREGYATITTKALDIHEDTFDGWLRVGLQNVRLENRRFPAGEGHPFMIDIMNSENPFTGTPGLPTGANGAGRGTTASTHYQTTFGRNTFLGGNAWINNYTGQPMEQEAGGAVFGAALVRDLRTMINVDVQLGALTLLESGTAQADTEVAFVNIDFAFGKQNYERDLPDHHSKFSILGVGFSSADAYVGSIGGGLSLFLADNLVEIFGEGQYQAGSYVKLAKAAGVGGSDITRHESWGGYGGIRLQMPWHPNRFYIEAQGVFVMGDDGSTTRSNGRQRTNRDFMSLENNNHTLIIEGNQAGLDIDSNYFAIKGEIGLTVWGQLDLKLIGGVFNLIHAPNAQTHEWGQYVAPARVSSAAALANYEFDDNLGIEVDVRVAWRPSDTVSLYAVYGTLFGSDFLDDVFDVSTLSAGLIGASIRF